MDKLNFEIVATLYVRHYFRPLLRSLQLDQKTDAVVVLNMILSTLQHTEWVSHQKLILAKVCSVS